MAQYNRDSSSRSRASQTSRETRGNSRSSSTRTPASSTRKQSSNNRSGNTTNIILAVLIVLLVFGGIMGALVYTNVSYLYDEERIIPGIVISGVDVGGMDRDEAYVALSTKLNNDINSLSVTFTYEGEYWNFKATDLQANGDVSGILDEVIMYGHAGTLRERMDTAEYVLLNEELNNVAFAFDESVLTGLVENIKAEVDTPAKEAALQFDPEAGQIGGVDENIALLYNPLKYEQSVTIGGQEIPVTLDAKGNSTIENNIFTFSDGSDGFEVDVVATVSAAMADLQDDYVANVSLVTNVLKPTTDKSQLSNYTSLVYHSKSRISSNYSEEQKFARDTNIATGLGAFDGLVLMPGELISFNKTTGERNAENGYLEAPVIAQDKSIAIDYGGGICQSATIMANAAMMSGCQVTRNSHSWPSYYENYNFGQKGLDAMVNWGTSDLTIRNTTEYPIYFDTYLYYNAYGKAVWGYCNVYTKLLPDGQKYVIDSRNERNNPPSQEPGYIPLTDITKYADKKWYQDTERNVMVYQYAKPRNEIVQRVFRQTQDSTGNVIAEEELYLAHYKAVAGTFYTKPIPVESEVIGDGTGNGTTN